MNILYEKQAVAIVIGVNEVNPKSYNGWVGKLNAPETDARLMASILSSQGVQVELLLTKDATSGNLKELMIKVAAELASGSTLFLYYSGHGNQVPDQNKDETDGLDETICLYNRQFLDDEKYMLLKCFKPGVRIVDISDCCHSSTNARAVVVPSVSGTNVCEKSGFISDAIFTGNEVLDKSTQNNLPEASIIKLSSSMDHQLSWETSSNGVFTEALKKVWDNGRFQGNYRTFLNAISASIGTSYVQAPTYQFLGAPNSEFENEAPFSIHE